METFSCVRRPHGLHIVRSESQEDQTGAFEAFIPACLIARSSVLQHLAEDVAEGASFNLPAPTGYMQAWLVTLGSVHSEERFGVDTLGEGIMAADYLKDNELVQHLCRALAEVVGHYFLAENQSRPLPTDPRKVFKVLESLSGPLVATVLRAAPVSLTQQLRRLPPSTHPHAMHAAYPDLANTSSLSLNCATLDATSVTLALSAVTHPAQAPLHSLTISGIATLATLQAPTISADFVMSVASACMGVRHVALDFREPADASLPGLAVRMDPSATEGVLRGLGGNTALESLEVDCWEGAPVVAFLEGGGCARQLKSLKLDIRDGVT